MNPKYRFEMAPLADHYVVAAKDLETGDPVHVFTLNGTAAEMLQLLLDGLQPEAVAENVARRHSAPLDRVTHDLQSFLKRLENL